MNQDLLDLCQKYVQTAGELGSVNEAIDAQNQLQRSDREARDAARRLKQPPPETTYDKSAHILLNARRTSLNERMNQIEGELKRYFRHRD